MNKIVLALTLSLVSVIGLQAGKFHDALAKLEAIGKRPRITIQDIENFENAANKLDAIMNKTDSKIIEAWVNQKITQLAQKRYTHQPDTVLDEAQSNAMARLAQNPQAREFYESTIAPRLNTANPSPKLFDDATINQALAYYKAAVQGLSPSEKDMYRNWLAHDVLAYAIIPPRIVDILAALDETLEIAFKRGLCDFFGSRERLAYFIIGAFVQVFGK